MQNPETTNQQTPWPIWQRLLFRFGCIYFMLIVLSVRFFENKPIVGWIDTLQKAVIKNTVNAFNHYILQNPETLSYLNVSTDTPFKWVQSLLYLLVAVLGTFIWTLADKNRLSYTTQQYYLKRVLCYFVALVSFVYGSAKLFPLQMPFPSLSRLAMPMGSQSPEQFLWGFYGYGTAYQVFLGVVEVAAGILLLYRRTTVLGVCIALGAYVNVLLVNFSYDVPVKIFTTQLVVICLYLLWDDLKVLYTFFVLNKPVAPKTFSVAAAAQGRQAIRAGKVFFTFVVIGLFGSRAVLYVAKEDFTPPVPYGFYSVEAFVRNGDTLPVLANDSLAWKDFVFEKDYNFATVNTSDPLLSRYGLRKRFYYRADTLRKQMRCMRDINGRSVAFVLDYTLPEKNIVELKGNIDGDTVYYKLRRDNRRLRLAEKEFNWVTQKGTNLEGF